VDSRRVLTIHAIFITVNRLHSLADPSSVCSGNANASDWPSGRLKGSRTSSRRLWAVSFGIGESSVVTQGKSMCKIIRIPRPRDLGSIRFLDKASKLPSKTFTATIHAITLRLAQCAIRRKIIFLCR